MRRLTKKITSIVLLASFTASLSSMALAADVGTVTDDCVRLRRKASTSSDSLGMLVKGDKVSILDQEDNGWLKITYTDSEGTHTGYVSGEFVKTNSTKKTDSKKNPSKDTKKATKEDQKGQEAAGCCGHVRCLPGCRHRHQRRQEVQGDQPARFLRHRC